MENNNQPPANFRTIIEIDRPPPQVHGQPRCPSSAAHQQGCTANCSTAHRTAQHIPITYPGLLLRLIHLPSGIPLALTLPVTQESIRSHSIGGICRHGSATSKGLHIALPFVASRVQDGDRSPHIHSTVLFRICGHEVAMGDQPATTD